MTTLTNQIDNSITNSALAMAEKISVIKNNHLMNAKFLEKVKEVMPAFEKIITKEGYEIVKLFTIKTGLDADWKDGDSMKVEIRLRPMSGKVKFIQFAGYTRSGAGKNQDRLKAKANKLVDLIKKGTGLINVQVNQFSFEIRNEEEAANQTVMVDFWIK